jgi:hypothetical protein
MKETVAGTATRGEIFSLYSLAVPTIELKNMSNASLALMKKRRRYTLLVKMTCKDSSLQDSTHDEMSRCSCAHHHHLQKMRIWTADASIGTE